MEDACGFPQIAHSFAMAYLLCKQDGLQSTHMSIAVFWIENGKAEVATVGDQHMLVALKFMEDLRRKRAAGDDITHVCMQSELADDVTKPGVNDVLPDGYDWKKRRV